MNGDGEKQRSSGEVPRITGREPTLPTVNPALEKPEPAKPSLHPAFYVVSWIGFSSAVILFNKYLLDTAGFRFPIVLTTWHMLFATFMTQVLARTTTLFDGRKKIKLTGRLYLRAIMPIGFFFSLSLICGNKSYLYLSVAFIQMLKATMPVMTLLTTWILGVAPPNYRQLGNVSFIVIGVIIASIGEIRFVLVGFLWQAGGIVFEAVRLTMVQALLSGDLKMDPMVSLYYFAPVCAVMNGVTALFVEVPTMSMNDIYNVGFFVLILNAGVAFMLNVAVVFLIGKTSSLVLTLCGVLKDILLVAASMIIWGTPVSGLQFFGYSIALSGLVYYRLGGEKLKGYFNDGTRMWAEFGAQRPAARRLVIIGAAFFAVFLLLGGLAPTFAPQATAEYTKDLKTMLGGVTGGKLGN